MKIFTCNNAPGHYLSSCVVVSAGDAKIAAQKINKELKTHGVQINSENKVRPIHLTEFKSGVSVLFNGDY